MVEQLLTWNDQVAATAKQALLNDDTCQAHGALWMWLAE